MKPVIRLIVLISLMVIAVVMAALTLADFQKSSAPTPTGTLVLGSYGDAVAVFDGGDLRNPLQITEIELDTLRSGDRALIEAGMTVSSREELVQLLEDLGS